MLNAVLFDLDNTLIRFNEARFFESYLAKVTPVFADIMSPGVFVERLLTSSHALLGNNGEMLNVEYFMNAFCRGYEQHRDEIWRRFSEFYETEYDQFRALVTVPPGVREVMLTLRRRGVKLVIASNPLWPQQVQLKRLSWAGVGDLDFALVTHLENMSYCKPRIEYYRELCSKIGEAPGTCLMVGNDPVNDMAVARIGMSTFLVTNDPGDEDAGLELSKTIRTGAPDEKPEPDFTGTLTDVPGAVDALVS